MMLLLLQRPGLANGFRLCDGTRRSLSTTVAMAAKTTGAFKRRLADVYPAQTHYKRALKGLKSVRVDTSIKNIRYFTTPNSLHFTLSFEDITDGILL